MSSVADTLRGIFPDFEKARRARRRIRRQYRENLKSLERGDSVKILQPSEPDAAYLNRKSEEACSKSDHLIRENGSHSRRFSYQIRSNPDEVREAMEVVIRLINRQNYVSIIAEGGLIIFGVLIVGFAIFLGMAGIETAFDEIGKLLSLEIFEISLSHRRIA